MLEHLQSAALTHAGNARALNEDAFYEKCEYGIWCIADGMGGYDAGEVAATLVVDAVAAVTPQRRLQVTTDSVSEAIQRVNGRLVAQRSNSSSQQMMGCTVLALVVSGYECRCLWAGDSRLYLYRQNGLYQLSKDHSVVQELVDNGIIADGEQEQHPQRHVITRAVGVDMHLQLDFLAFELQPEDVLLMCSDGLYSELTPEQIMSVLALSEPCEDKARILIQQVLAGRARDNVTVNIIEVI